MMATPATASDVVKDNYIPIFSCRPTDYRDWRARIMLYWKKMELQKREQEATINLARHTATQTSPYVQAMVGRQGREAQCRRAPTVPLFG